jgi:hypothetical protein
MCHEALRCFGKIPRNRSQPPCPPRTNPAAVFSANGFATAPRMSVNAASSCRRQVSTVEKMTHKFRIPFCPSVMISIGDDFSGRLLKVALTSCYRSIPSLVARSAWIHYAGCNVRSIISDIAVCNEQLARLHRDRPPTTAATATAINADRRRPPTANGLSPRTWPRRLGWIVSVVVLNR